MAQLDKLEEIISGWKNYIFPNEQMEELAKERIKICLACSKLTDKKFCGICHCYMPAKVRSYRSSCPIEKW